MSKDRSRVNQKKRALIKSRQLYLFKRIRTGRSVISFEEKPFPHIKIEYKNSSIMLPVEELRKAKKLIDGFTREEKRVIRKILASL